MSDELLDMRALPDRPWTIADPIGDRLQMWQVVDAHDHTIVVCRDEVAARAVVSIPLLATEIQRLRNENANLDSACKIADRRNEELQKMLAGAGLALRSYECGNAAPALAKAYADKIEALLNTESEP